LVLFLLPSVSFPSISYFSFSFLCNLPAPQIFLLTYLFIYLPQFLCFC
jgi:hypothetical protein